MMEKVKASWSKKPITNEPSRFVVDCLSKLKLSISSLILDVPCGYGRHSVLLADLGYSVYSVDLDFNALKNFKNSSGRIARICIDLDQGLPFRSEVFTLIIIVDYVQKGLLSYITELLKPGGYLIYQTYGAHGQNWITLPQMGETVAELESKFNLITFIERTAGPKVYGRATIKLFAQKLPKFDS